MSRRPKQGERVAMYVSAEFAAELAELLDEHLPGIADSPQDAIHHAVTTLLEREREVAAHEWGELVRAGRHLQLVGASHG